ncbi:MAG: TonB family protein [Candidatus Omnitrophica bacterium]|nr:TonB family protein [Candidatus Omnitrophota bacterium]
MKKTKTFARLLLTMVMLAAGAWFAPSRVYPEFFFSDYDLGRQLDVVVGESKVVEVANPKRIAIGDPKIADVVGASRTEILVSAKEAGETNLQIWDDYGQREVMVRVFEEDLKKLKKRLEDLFATAGLRGVYFQVGEQERKVFVLGEVPLRKKDIVVQLLENFRARTIDLVTFKEDNPLVEIDVQVIEIAKTVIDRLGINWSQSLVFNEVPTPAAHTLIRQAADVIKAVGQSQFDRTALTATLNILEQDNLARTLARPKLVALSGKEAKILVGGEVPILSSVSVSSGTTTTAVDYVEYGIKLNIKPEVKETGDIQCSLEIEIKTIDSSTQLTVQTGTSISTTTPGFKTRNVSSELYLKNNETIFLAGLIDNEQTNNLQQVPGLGNLPIFGALFRSKNFQVGNTELVVSLTPKVVRYGDMLQDVEESNRGKMSPDEEPADAYVRSIQDIIYKNVAYPVEAQRANLSGEVVMSLHLLSNGQLVGVVVNQSSGHKLLDRAAVYTVKRLAPYPVFPKGLLLKEIWVEVPIAYQAN